MTKAFSPFTSEHNEIVNEYGLAVYEELCKQFPGKNIEDFDFILNSLCCALGHLISQNVPKDNRSYLIQLVHKILTNNLSQ